MCQKPIYGEFKTCPLKAEKAKFSHSDAKIKKTLYLRRRNGRVVDCGGLENRCPGDWTGGSNPSFSATPIDYPEVTEVGDQIRDKGGTLLVQRLQIFLAVFFYDIKFSYQIAAALVLNKKLPLPLPVMDEQEFLFTFNISNFS